MARLHLRALDASNLEVAAAVGASAFGLDMGNAPGAALWRARIAYPLETDPQGAHVAELGGEIVGLCQAIKRERVWCLSLLAVSPSAQSSGAGRALMERALTYATETTDIGLITSSSDPRALRLYALSGFALLPTFEVAGTLDRSALPQPVGEVHAAGREDFEALAPISREVRGAPHTLELEYLLRVGGRILRLGERGFAAVLPGRGVWLLVARDDAAAAQLLWAALTIVDTEQPTVRWITSEQQWAIEIAVQAGLRLVPHGALCVRGQPGPLRAYLPSGPFA
ncbi:MAG TPA: GNAT family N-acetyltransferase [Solirubrobacteraceae bacterium]